MSFREFVDYLESRITNKEIYYANAMAEEQRNNVVDGFNEDIAEITFGNDF